MGIKSKLLKILFWIWLLLIFTVSSLPKLPDIDRLVGWLGLPTDSLMHWFEYTVLIFLFTGWRALIKQGVNINIVITSLLTGIILATIDEFHQLLIPGRDFNPFDILCNYLGVITGISIAFVWVRLRVLLHERSLKKH